MRELIVIEQRKLSFPASEARSVSAVEQQKVSFPTSDPRPFSAGVELFLDLDPVLPDWPSEADSANQVAERCSTNGGP